MPATGAGARGPLLPCLDRLSDGPGTGIAMDTCARPSRLHRPARFSVATVRAAVVHPVPFAALLHLTACVIRAHPRPPQALEAVFEWRRKREEKGAEEVFYSRAIPLPAPHDLKARLTAVAQRERVTVS